MRLIKSILPLVAVMVVAITLLVTAGCSAGPTETRDDSFSVNGTATLVVNGDNGWIKVNTGTDDEVRIQATLRGIDRIDYEVSQDGNTITVLAEIDQGWFISNVGVDITITAPVSTDVELEISNGAIELNGIEGTGTLRTSNGEIVLENVKGDFEGRTSNGKIEVDTLEGTAFLRTSNGGLDHQQRQCGC